jgi:spore germination cell wall hydrolase CwlJ-like protein
MVASRRGSEWIVGATFGLASVLFLSMATTVGYQDLTSLIAQQPQVAAHWHDHLIASPFGTIHAATFSLPRPLGTAMPDPEGFKLASFEVREPDPVIAEADGVEVADPTPMRFPTVNRLGKGDRLLPRPRGDATERAAVGPEPLPPDLAAAIGAPSAAAKTLEQEAAPQPPDIQVSPSKAEDVDLSILDAAADPDPTRRTAEIYFDNAPATENLASIEPWARGEEPTLIEPRQRIDSDIKQAALNPTDAGVDPRSNTAGVTVAGKGEVTGEGHRPKSPAERLGLDGKARAKAEKCLANAVYFEARGEPVRGQIAVAQVVMNRVFSGYYPSTVCGVVYQNANHHLACQFTFACDGIPDVVNEPEAWTRAKQIATATLDGRLWLPEIGKATHYHAYWVHPTWVRTMHKLYRIGVHTFYRPRRWGDGAEAPSWGTARETTDVVSKL